MNDEINGLTPGERYRSADAWAWAHEDNNEPLPEVDAGSVCAVMVVHNAAEWLPRQLLALAQLEPRPGRLVAVDNGSDDGSDEILQKALDEGVITKLLRCESTSGFGSSVAQALGDHTHVDWIWLLHDDSAPKADALAELLRAAQTHRADILVPKLLAPQRRNYPDQVLEVGRSIGSGGRDAHGLEPGDIDQGHLDPEPTLGGSTAGMLVSSQVWFALGGLDEGVPLFRDGVGLGWRANERGYRVLTCPQAALYHRQAGRLGWRRSVLAPRPHALDRLGAMRLLAAHSTRPRTFSFWLCCTSLLRMIGFLLGKSPSRTRDEWHAMMQFIRTKQVTAAMRDRLVNAGPVTTDVTPLLPKRYAGIRHAADRVGAAIVERYRDLFSTESETSIDELTGDDFAGHHRGRRRVAPLAAMSLLLFVLGLVAARQYFGLGVLQGGQLLPAPETLGEAWDAFLTPTAGVPGDSPLWLGFMALGSTLALGQPEWWVFGLLVLAPLLAAWAANAFVRLFVDDPWPRAVLASAWGVSVWVLGFVGAGSLTGLSWVLTLPLFARAVAKWMDQPSVGAERWRGPAAAAGWLTLLVAAYPLALPIAVVAGVFLAIRQRERIPEVLVAVIAPILLILGWMPSLFTQPARLLTGTDPLTRTGPAPDIGLVIGMINEAAPHFAVGTVYFAALFLVAAWLILTGRVSVRTSWIVSGMVATGYFMAAGLSRLVLPIASGMTRPEIGPWIILVIAGFLASVLFPEPDRERQVRGPLILIGVAAVVVLGWVSVSGIGGPVGLGGTKLPNYVTSVIESERMTRALIVDADGSQARWSIVSSAQPQWGSAEHDMASPDGEIAAAMTTLAESFAAGQLTDDAAKQLGSLAIGHVWVRGASPDQIAAISNAAGLSRAAADDHTQVWTVGGTPSRVSVVSGETSQPVVEALVPEGAENRLLVLADAPDQRWQVSVAGRSLPPTDAVRPTFLLADHSGELAWGMARPYGYQIVQALVVTLLVLLAAPVAGGTAQARRGVEE